MNFDSVQTFLYHIIFTGGYLLYVYWSDQLVPECPHKITVTSKGTGRKVKVTGQGLKGGFVGQELRVIVDTTEAGYGRTSRSQFSY